MSVGLDRIGLGFHKILQVVAANFDPRSHSVDPRHSSGVTGEISTRFSTAKLVPWSDGGLGPGRRGWTDLIL